MNAAKPIPNKFDGNLQIQFAQIFSWIVIEIVDTWLAYSLYTNIEATLFW